MGRVAAQEQPAPAHRLATKDRSGAMDFSIDGPVTSRAACSEGMRRFSSSQNASSLQSSTRSSRLHWM
jgi:hypothetical protein